MSFLNSKVPNSALRKNVSECMRYGVALWTLQVSEPNRDHLERLRRERTIHSPQRLENGHLKPLVVHKRANRGWLAFLIMRHDVQLFSPTSKRCDRKTCCLFILFSSSIVNRMSPHTDTEPKVFNLCGNETFRKYATVLYFLYKFYGLLLHK